MMKTLALSFATTYILIAQPCTGFNKYHSSFTGRASSVCSRAELTTALSCPPSQSTFRRGSNMSMPPFLKKLGLKKPEKPILDSGNNDEEATSSISNDKVSIVSENENDEECVVEEELSETQKLLKQVKEAGTAGVISYALWELGFWTFSVPVCIFGYREVTGHWPDFSDQEDLQKLGAEAFAFVNFARFAVPLRIGLALGTTPWIQENIVDKFMTKEDPNICEPIDEEVTN